ncbi:ferredoxin family protein [Chloroflexota bacterium]
MTGDLLYAVPNIPTPHQPIVFNLEICTGCNICVETCQMDVFIPNPEKRQAPILLFPDECIYCSACIAECPNSGAVELKRPLAQRIQ